MPQHVKRPGHVHFLQEWRPHPGAPVVIVDGVPARSWEHKLAGRAQAMKPQLPHQLLCEWDTPAAVRSLEVRPGAVSRLAYDADGALLDIDLLPLKPRDFTE